MAQVYKSAGIEAARIAGESVVMDSTAASIAAKARSNAQGHGSLSSRISAERARGKRGVTDRIVALDHPEAENIEFGHINARNGEWVKGLWVMRNAYDEL